MPLLTKCNIYSLADHICRGIYRYYNHITFDSKEKYHDFLFYRMCDSLNLIIVINKTKDIEVFFKEGSNLLIRTANNRLLELKDSIKNFNTSIKIHTLSRDGYTKFKSFLKNINVCYLIVNGDSLKRFVTDAN